MPGQPAPYVIGRALRWCASALVATGAAQVGGFPDSPPPTQQITRTGSTPRISRQDLWVEREAARGIADLERMLARQPRQPRQPRR